MPIPRRHGTEPKVSREYSGQEQTMRLIEWLNEPTKDRGHQRVREIVEICTRLQMSGRVGKTKGSAADHFIWEDHTKLIKRLGKLLRQYKYYPGLFALGPISGRTWYPAPKGSKYSDGWAPDYDDANAVFDLTQLAEDKLLERIKQCICGRWVFARFSHQRFCSMKCREKEFRSSPEWKAYRRKKAREYYQLHKSGKVK